MDAFSTIDTGRTRTAADTLHIAGEKGGAYLAAAIRFVIDYEHERVFNKDRIPNSSIVDFVVKNPGIKDSLSFVFQERKSHRLLSASIAAGLHYLMKQKDAVMANTLIHGIEKGFLVDEGVGSTFIALREKLISCAQDNARTHPRKLAIFVIKAWNARRKNETVKLFRFVDGEKFPKVH